MLGTNYSQNLNPFSVSILIVPTTTAADTSTLPSKISSSLLAFSLATVDGLASVADDSSVLANQNYHGIVDKFRFEISSSRAAGYFRNRTV